MHLLFTPFFARIVLVEAGQVAIVALIERLILDHGQIGLPDFVEDDAVRVLRARQNGGKGNVEGKPLLLDRLPGRMRFLFAEFGEARIAPAGEQVFLVPFALSVANEH